MKKINASSDEINKVVKVINDIAFQLYSTLDSRIFDGVKLLTQSSSSTVHSTSDGPKN